MIQNADLEIVTAGGKFSYRQALKSQGKEKQKNVLFNSAG